jgi:hypothetical protein
MNRRVVVSLVCLIGLIGMFGDRNSYAEVGAPPVTIKEPGSGVGFESTRMVDGRPLVLLGTGLRKKFVVKVYAMGLYVDEAEARRNFPALVARAGGRDRAHLVAGDHAQAFVVWGQFTKVGVMHMVRSVDADKIKGAFQDALEDELSDKAPPELKAATEAFLGLIDTGHDILNGQEIVLKTTADGHIELDLAGQKKVGPQNAKLARALWNVWLGPKTISKDMRASLVDRIDLLGK